MLHKDGTPDIDTLARDDQDEGGQSSRFELTPAGVFFRGEDAQERLRICGPLFIDAETRNQQGNSWGRKLRWFDAEGREHQWVMPVSLLAGDGNEIREH